MGPGRRQRPDGSRYDARFASRLFATCVLLTAFAAPLVAAGDEPRWGLTIWGVSYHIDKSIDYSTGNWGLGGRYYLKPRRLFIEADALRNSNRGLVLPISIGAEFGLVSFSGGCRLAAVAALTAAYYENQAKDTTEIKAGPVPGVSLGCGRFQVNMVAILKAARPPLAALAASMTVLF